MHYVHYVYLIGDVEDDQESITALASDCIESYRDEVFDSIAAVPGAVEPPSPISYRKEKDRFLAVLAECRERQRKTYQDLLAALARELHIDVGDPAVIGSVLLTHMNHWEVTAPRHALWIAKQLVSLARGDYIFESGFYHNEHHDARIASDQEVAEAYARCDHAGSTEELYIVPLNVHI